MTDSINLRSEDFKGKDHFGETEYFIPLGYDMKYGDDFGAQEHFFYNKRTKELMKISDFELYELLTLAPLEYWRKNYPVTEEDYKEMHFNTLYAIDALIQMSIKIGVFKINMWENLKTRKK